MYGRIPECIFVHASMHDCMYAHACAHILILIVSYILVSVFGYTPPLAGKQSKQSKQMKARKKANKQSKQTKQAKQSNQRKLTPAAQWQHNVY